MDFIHFSISKQNQIISIEASNDTFDELIKNLNLNNFFNIKPFNYAVSDIDGKVINLKRAEKIGKFNSTSNYNFINLVK